MKHFASEGMKKESNHQFIIFLIQLCPNKVMIKLDLCHCFVYLNCEPKYLQLKNVTRL